MQPELRPRKIKKANLEVSYLLHLLFNRSYKHAFKNMPYNTSTQFYRFGDSVEVSTSSNQNVIDSQKEFVFNKLLFS